MSKYIKNNDTVSHTYSGQEITAGSYYEVQSVDENNLSNNSQLISDIGSGIALMAKDDSGNNDITDVNQAIDFLKNNMTKEVTVWRQPAFADKKIWVNGVEKNLFKRVHGVSETITAGQTVNIDFVVPYAQCKFTGANIFGCKLEDTLNFKVLDDASNTYSGAPGSNYMLNQFGYDVELPDNGVYENTSNYDADLYIGMILRCEYTNNGNADKYIAMNVWLHEVK